MSGNSTRLGVALGTDPFHAAMPGLLIAGFLGGVIAGAIAARWAGARRKAAVLSTVCVMLLTAAMGRAWGNPAMMLGGMVVAMGALNNTFQRGGEVSVGLTYMTGALVKLGQGIAAALAGEKDSGSGAWAALWAGLLAGAVLGAFLQDRLPMGCLWIAAAWSMLMTAIALRLPAES